MKSIVNGKSTIDNIIQTMTKSESFQPYFYDDSGLRISRTDNLTGLTTYYVWDSENPTGYPQVVEEIENNQVVRRYGYGHFLENVDIWNGTNFERFYVVRDGTNSVRMLLDSTGSIAATYDYDAFGNVLSASNANHLTIGNPYQFHSEYLDSATGFVYLRARWYDIENGRFLRADSYEGVLEQPISLHKYLSFNNDAINNQDPSGKSIGSIGEIINPILGGIRWGTRIGELLRGYIGSLGGEPVLDVISVIQRNFEGNYGAKHIKGMTGYEKVRYYAPGGVNLYERVDNVIWGRELGSTEWGLDYDFPTLPGIYDITYSSEGFPIKINTYLESGIKIHKQFWSEGYVVLGTDPQDIYSKLLNNVQNNVKMKAILNINDYRNPIDQLVRPLPPWYPLFFF